MLEFYCFLHVAFSGQSDSAIEIKVRVCIVLVVMFALRNRIKDLREDADLTQQQLADQIGITQRKYSYIETGIQPLTDEILIKISNYYQVSIDYLLCQTNNPERNK